MVDAMEYRHLMKYNQHKKVWKYSFANELGRLAQGTGKRVKGTDTILVIDYRYIPSERCKYIAYVCIVVDYRQKKEDPNRTGLTFGGNLTEYPRDVITPNDDTTTANIV